MDIAEFFSLLADRKRQGDLIVLRLSGHLVPWPNRSKSDFTTQQSSFHQIISSFHAYIIYFLNV